MRILKGIVPGVSRLARLQFELSKKARQNLKWFSYYQARGNNACLTCRHLDISPQTFYRWKRRYNPKYLASLADRSHHPKHLRQPTYSAELVEAVLRLREEGTLLYKLAAHLLYVILDILQTACFFLPPGSLPAPECVRATFP